METLDALAALSRKLHPLRGRGAVGNFLHRYAAAKSDRRWSIRMRDGSVIEAPRSSAMSWVPAFTGRYDPEKLDLILRFLEPNSFALDVGGCFGFYSIPMGIDAARKSAQVIAFEAIPGNERILRENIARNDLSGVVTSVPIGLGRTAATVSMIIEAGGAGNAFVVSEVLDQPEKTKVNQVRIERLDDLAVGEWTTKQRCSLVKMDIEGFELEALAGAEEFIRRHRPVIFGEFNGWFMERNGVAATAIQDWADVHAYHSFDLLCERESWLWDNAKLLVRRLSRDTVRAGGDLLLIPVEASDLQGRI